MFVKKLIGILAIVFLIVNISPHKSAGSEITNLETQFKILAEREPKKLIEKIEKYFFDNLPDINTANQEELKQLSGVGPQTASYIIEYREEMGPFTEVEQLRQVFGIGPATARNLKSEIAIDGKLPVEIPDEPEKLLETYSVEDFREAIIKIKLEDKNFYDYQELENLVARRQSKYQEYLTELDTGPNLSREETNKLNEKIGARRKEEYDIYREFFKNNVEKYRKNFDGAPQTEFYKINKWGDNYRFWLYQDQDLILYFVSLDIPEVFVYQPSDGRGVMAFSDTFATHSVSKLNQNRPDLEIELFSLSDGLGLLAHYGPAGSGSFHWMRYYRASPGDGISKVMRQGFQSGTMVEVWEDINLAHAKQNRRTEASGSWYKDYRISCDMFFSFRSSGQKIYDGCSSYSGERIPVKNAEDRIDFEEAIVTDTQHVEGSYNSLFAAADSGNEEKVKNLLESGEEVNAVSHGGLSPLMAAAFQGHHEIVEILLEQGAQVNYKNQFNQLAVHIAANKGHKKVVKLLLDNNSKLNVPDKDGRSPLFMAADKGDHQLVQILLEAGASTEKDFYWRTALHGAVDANSLKTLELLEDQEGKINQPDAAGRTPLHWVISLEREQLLDYMLQNANLNVQDKRSRTPLIIAIKNKYDTGARRLLQKETDVNLSDGAGNTPLIMATRVENLNLVELLLAEEADISATNNAGVTALQLAVGNQLPEISKTLINGGADVNHQDKKEYAPLHIAAQNGDTKILNILLSAGAKLNLHGRDENTPLHKAIIKNQKETVRILLEKGADTTKKNSDGLTPKQMAQEEELNKIFELIKEYQ